MNKKISNVIIVIVSQPHVCKCSPGCMDNVSVEIMLCAAFRGSFFIGEEGLPRFLSSTTMQRRAAAAHAAYLCSLPLHAFICI